MTGRPMRILCLNANTTPFVTRVVADEMRATLGGAAEVVEATASFGPAVIRTRADHAVATHGAVDLAERHGRDVDAVMVAVSMDTALSALREMLDVPVVGMTEASVALARLHGLPIGYVTIGASMLPLYRETLGHCAIERDGAGWRAIDAPSAYREGDKSALDDAVLEAAASLAADGAGVVVLVGAVMAGAARRAGPRSPAPLIDGGAAGALMARAMVDVGRRQPG